MNIHLIQNVETLIGSTAEWSKLAGSFPFFGPEWLLTWLQRNTEDVDPAVLVAVDNSGHWLGMAPFCVDKRPVRFFRRLRFLGSGDTCSDYMGLISPPESSRAFAESVGDWLFENIHPQGPVGQIDRIELEGVESVDSDANYFDQVMEALGFKIESIPIEGCWAVDLPSSWEELNASFSKSMRRKTKKAVKQLADPQTDTWTSRNHCFEELWQVFIDLHQKRRAMLGQPGCFANSRFEAFLKDATEQLFVDHRAEIIQIDYQNRPLASVLMLHDHATSYLYQSGMEPDLASLNPGYQLVIAAIQNSMQHGITRFDFLRGDEPYKARWSTTRIPLVTKRFVPRDFRARIKHSIWSTGQAIKNQIKKSASS
jgi:CelD/BcsL family acetyltransferase involved in cellulose biosynthesis